MDNSGSRSRARIAAIDALRGFALVGILLINITSMGGPIDSDYPASKPTMLDSEWQVWWAANLFVAGAFRGLFSLLFGASALLFLREGNREMAFLRRCGWLLAFAVVNEIILLWPGDVLLIYALAGPFLLLFRNSEPRRMFVAAAVLIAVMALWPYVMPHGPAVVESVKQQAAALAAERAARLGTYRDTVAFMLRTDWQWTYKLKTFWWIMDAAAFMLIGMALYRYGILSASARIRTYALFALIGFGVGLPLRAGLAWLAFGNGGDFPPIADAVFQFGRLLMTFGWLGVFMLAWKLLPWRALFAPLSALGRMALTGYLLQSAIAAFIFSGFGLGLWGAFNWPQMWALVPIIMAVIAAFCMAWLARFEMGPAEWLWRALIFWTPPPLLKAAT